MSDTILDRFTIGAGKLLPVDHTGPASYTTGGEPLGATNSITGIAAVGLGSIDIVLGSGNLSLSGNYQVAAQQSGLGSRKTFNLLWFYATAQGGITGITSSGGSGMTAGTYNLTIGAPPAGGVQATGTITVTTSTVTAINITNPGKGYIAAPAVSAATGGTPPTLTATVGVTSDTQVASGTNLSGETVRIAYVGR